MELKTYHDLQTDILGNLWKVPDEVDVIVGFREVECWWRAL